MREQPTGSQLLETARQVLREELIPSLPADKRHAALMIANAMAIAARQMKNGDSAERCELAALEKLLGLPANQVETPAALSAALSDANRRLSHAIRIGDADGRPLHAHLLQTARHKVSESNPKYLGDSAR